MRPILSKIILCTFALLNHSLLFAEELSEITNFRWYSDVLSSSGQPSAEQLQKAAQSGFDRVIYLAFTDNHTAIENEDSIVKGFGMEYVHIPVDYDRPTASDFKTFVGVMEQNPSANTLVHCQVNFRASTFSFLYRVIFLDIPIDVAKNDLDSIWIPNETWFRFIRTTLKEYGLSHACETCDWGELEFLSD